MPTAEDVAAVRRLYAAVAAGDLAAVAACFHEEAIWHLPGRGALAGTHRGWAAIRDDLLAKQDPLSGGTVEVGFVDQGSTGPDPAAAAATHGIRLEVVKLPAAERGFVLLPRHWVVERGFAWTGRFRRLARDDVRLHTTLEGFRDVAFAVLTLKAVLPVLAVQ